MGTETYHGQRVAVTGGNGYLGSRLVAALRQLSAEVFVIDTRATGVDNEYVVDLTNAEAVATAMQSIKPQIVFHLAALLDRQRTFDNHELVTRVNYGGTVNLLMAMRDIPYARFVLASSSEIYGDVQAPFHEGLLPHPASPYSMSKVMAETALQTFSDIYQKPYTVARLFNFFGEGMPQNFFLSQLVHSLRHEERFAMTKGEQLRDFLYTDDVIAGLLHLAVYPDAANQIVNVCSGEAMSIKDFALNCKKLLSSKCVLDMGAIPYRENEIWNMTGCNKKLASLGFTPKHDILEMILLKNI